MTIQGYWNDCEPYFFNLHLHCGLIRYRSHNEKTKQLNSLESIDYFNLSKHKSIYIHVAS